MTRMLSFSLLSYFLTFILTFFCSTDGGHYWRGRGCGGRVVGRSAFELLGLQLCVDPKTLQRLSREISLQHRCLLITVVQAEGYVPVSGGPGSTQVHQAQFVSVRGVSLILLVHLLSEIFKKSSIMNSYIVKKKACASATSVFFTSSMRLLCRW